MDREVYYIIYHTATLEIVETYKWCCKQILDTLDTSKELACINVTHPKNKKLLADINKTNGTTYA